MATKAPKVDKDGIPRGPLERKRAKYGWMFISPWLLGFSVFYLIPMAASAVFSTFDFQLSVPDEATYIGADNWRRALFDDPDVWRSWIVTLRFAAINVPLGLGIAFGFALLLNSEYLRARNMFRTLFYAPTVVPLIAATHWSSLRFSTLRQVGSTASSRYSASMPSGMTASDGSITRRSSR